MQNRRTLFLILVAVLLVGSIGWVSLTGQLRQTARAVAQSAPTKTKPQTPTRTVTRSATRSPTRSRTSSATRSPTRTLSRTATVLTPSIPVTATPTLESVPNGGFEASSAWLPSLDGVWGNAATGITPFVGDGFLRLTGCRRVSQPLVVPDAAPFLSFAYQYRMGAYDSCDLFSDLPWNPANAELTMSLFLPGDSAFVPSKRFVTEYDVSKLGVWQVRTLDLRAYRGQTIQIEIGMLGGAYIAAVDDLRFVAASLPATLTPLPRSPTATNGRGCPNCDLTPTVNP